MSFRVVLWKATLLSALAFHSGSHPCLHVTSPGFRNENDLRAHYKHATKVLVPEDSI